MIKNRNFIESFRCAIRGIVIAIKAQRNVRFHLAAAIAVVVIGLLLPVSPIEFALLMVAIAIVMVAELINSAMETSVDLVTKEYHPLAKDAKDIAAGGVLFAALMALVMGCVIFLGYGRFMKIIVLLFSTWQRCLITIGYIAISILFVFSRKN